jgi:diguanylate cyclase (GGDEF)-like protein
MGVGRIAMAKQVRLRTAGAKVRRVPGPPRTRGRPADGAAAPPARPTPSDPMRLAAEVARLEAELAAMRERITELEAHAESDPLTGVMNRRGFERELIRAAAYVQRYGGNAALVYLDLDGFKPVNDRFGHAAGDAVLVAVAATLVAAVRASDIVARIGGDEFAVLLWNLSPQDAGNKSQALERAVGATAVRWSGRRLAVGATAGVAEFLADRDAAGLLARADAAMYARKRKRKASGE